jgi:hypothetical protein
MSVTFTRPQSDKRRLQAMAASQSSGVAKRALADLRAQLHADLARSLGRL